MDSPHRPAITAAVPTSADAACGAPYDQRIDSVKRPWLSASSAYRKPSKTQERARSSSRGGQMFCGGADIADLDGNSLLDTSKNHYLSIR